MVLILTHSHAAEERFFSMIKKKNTTFRASMGFNTLCSLLTVTLANRDAVSFKPDQELQMSAKKATVEYNKEHSSSTSSSKPGQA